MFLSHDYDENARLYLVGKSNFTYKYDCDKNHAFPQVLLNKKLSKLDGEIDFVSKDYIVFCDSIKGKKVFLNQPDSHPLQELFPEEIISFCCCDGVKAFVSKEKTYTQGYSYFDEIHGRFEAKRQDGNSKNGSGSVYIYKNGQRIMPKTEVRKGEWVDLRMWKIKEKYYFFLINKAGFILTWDNTSDLNTVNSFAYIEVIFSTCG